MKTPALQQILQHDLPRHHPTESATTQNRRFQTTREVAKWLNVSQPDVESRNHVANVNVVGSSPITRFLHAASA